MMEGKTFRPPSTDVSQFYCYDLPVLATAPGYVIKIVDDKEDNKIGGVDLEFNWGNAIIIKHADGLYTKLAQ